MDVPVSLRQGRKILKAAQSKMALREKDLMITSDVQVEKNGGECYRGRINRIRRL